MTLDEAIKIKEEWDKAGAFSGNERLQQADRLSIEALKAEKHRREVETYIKHPLLPGETAE